MLNLNQSDKIIILRESYTDPKTGIKTVKEINPITKEVIKVSHWLHGMEVFNLSSELIKKGF